MKIPTPRLLLNLDLINGSCQKSCPQCIVPHMEDKKKISLDEIVRFLEINRMDLDKMEFCIVPMGEPLMHPWFWYILRELFRVGADVVNISTNLGYGILSESQAEMLSRVKVIVVDVNEVGQAPEQMEVTRINIELLRAEGANLELKRIYHPDFPEKEGIRTLPYVKHSYYEVMKNIAPRKPRTALRNYISAIGFEYDKNDPMMREQYGDHCYGQPCIPSQLNVKPGGILSSCSSVFGETAATDSIFSLGNPFKDPIMSILESEKGLDVLQRQARRMITTLCAHCRPMNPTKRGMAPGFPEGIRRMYGCV